MRRLPFFIILLVLLLLAVEAAAVPPASPSSSPTGPFRIGLTMSLTGRHAEPGRMQEKAFRLWQRDTNAQGGLLGRPVELVLYDDASNPETVVSLYRRLILQDKVDLLFLPYSSEMTEPVLPVTERYGYPVIASAASGDRLWEKGYSQFFGLYSLASRDTLGFLEMIAKARLSRIAVLHAEDAYSSAVAKGVFDWSRHFGLQVTFARAFPKGTKSFGRLVKEAHRTGAEALVVCAYFSEALDVRRACKKENWTPSAYFATIGPALPIYGETLRGDADLTFAVSRWEPRVRYPGAAAFQRTFVKAYGEEPSFQAANAYAAGQILAQAIKKAGRLDRPLIRHHLATMNTTTIVGRYGVDKAGRQIKHLPLVIQWQNGVREIVWPKHLQTAQPVFSTVKKEQK